MILTQCRASAGPTSQTMNQEWLGIGAMSRVYWGIDLVPEKKQMNDGISECIPNLLVIVIKKIKNRIGLFYFGEHQY